MSILDTNLKYLLFIIVLILIFVIQRIVIFYIRKTTMKGKIPADVVNGLIVLSRFGVVILIIYSAIIVLDVGQNTVISLSLFLGSMVSFASMHTIQNFVSGMYILLTRPFKINDFVRIGKSEGVVTEISLNYTGILNFNGLIESIPNKNIIGSIIINYDKKINSSKKEEQRLAWTKDILPIYDDNEITYYTFVWGAPLISLNKIKDNFDKICNKYESVFGYLPTYKPYTINHRFEFTFILKSDDPITILKNRMKFLDDISLQFH
ncbi:MAG: mechanosensitive ion channel [Candidatus Heimdallarchaeota archaeon]|nr:mechanosensitive ion channel [Candidatus Heimdallarchaeota archaeon]